MTNSAGRLVYKDFEAWVVVGDEFEKPLPQFGVEYKESTNEAIAWIPSEAGQRFAVRYRMAARIRRDTEKHGFVATLYLDGHKVDSVVHEKRLKSTRMMSLIETSPTETREFVFNPVLITDNDTYINHPLSTDVGEIKLVLQFASEIEISSPRKRNNLKELPEMQKIHERLKKELVHQIKFSECKVKPYRAAYGKMEFMTIGNPVTLIFNRSLAILQANRIAPYFTAPPAEAAEGLNPHRQPASIELRPHHYPVQTESPNSDDVMPIPAISSVKREDEDLNQGSNDLNEDDKIAARERELLAELEKIRALKRARQDTASHPAKKVKLE